MTRYTTFDEDLMQRLRNDATFAEAYLQVAIETFAHDGDTELFSDSLRRFITAKDSLDSDEVARASLTQIVSDSNNLNLSNILKICDALGYHLKVSLTKKTPRLAE